MHLSNTVGGYTFFNDDFSQELEEPVYKDIQGFSENVFKQGEKILDPGSKTGLYPLYITYTFYKNELKKVYKNDLDVEQRIELWDKIVKEQIFVLTNSEMARSITQKTLIGYRKKPTNIRYKTDLSKILKGKNTKKEFINSMHQGKIFQKEEGESNMRFSVIDGNPPYQEKNTILDNQNNASSLYGHFIELGLDLNTRYESMVVPSRWMTGGKSEISTFRKRVLESKNLKTIFDHKEESDLFTNVEIKGGICYLLFEKQKNEKKQNTILLTKILIIMTLENLMNLILEQL
ncbi:Eco57I restriction-modification methylase domain-containing protein [Mycoplasmopsis alligatoris]|uniref:Eco57I restriction endonuclease n=1 Tax=Mycoplasmopsis alligatoris A21JP2 TaxID=747682 RepID=D4XVJ9_9BACT|nr:Eco57I restriction-modification methylase domain-containing protein [Mycoplasmopsis alligatoris]EFF41687.1 Eco57I restriction endonuclease [Mycoplasmopsis alligatoris A21JP2]